MTTCLWRFPLAHVPRQTVSMPPGAVILSAQWTPSVVGNGCICLYAWSDPDSLVTEPRVIRMLVLGDCPPAEELKRLVFIDTAQVPHGETRHIFEEAHAENGASR